jgi:hypothetical protein
MNKRTTSSRKVSLRNAALARRNAAVAKYNAAMKKYNASVARRATAGHEDTRVPKPRRGKRSFDKMTAAEQDAYITESERMLDELDPATITAADRLEDLRAVRAIVDEQAELDERLADAVADAHANGRSWSDIATVLGVTKQSAHAKYARRRPRSVQSH